MLTKTHRFVRLGGRLVRASQRCIQRCCRRPENRVYVAERCDTVTDDPRFPAADPVFQPPKIRWSVLFLCPDSCEVGGSQLIVYHGYCYRVVLGGAPTGCDPGRAGPARLDRTDPVAADAVEVPGSEIVCQPRTENCSSSDCLVEPPPPECCNDGWDCQEMAANFPRMVGCFGCDCNCGGDFELVWSGFFSGNEYAPSAPCGGNNDPCSSLFCGSNLCYSVQLSWNVTIRFTCNPETRQWRAEFTSQEFRQQSQFVAGTCGCASDQPAPVSYLGPIVQSPVRDPSGSVPPCGMPPHLIPLIADSSLPIPEPSLCQRCGVQDACAGQGAWAFWRPPTSPPSCEWSENLGNDQPCGTFGNVRGEIHASCSGGVLEQVGRFGEMPCPGGAPGGVRADGRLYQQWAYHPINPCDPDRVRPNDLFDRLPRRAFL